MPSTSSLLRSAEAARKKTIAYEDQVAAFEWNMSAKTIDDYDKYSQYLQKRAETSAQPSDALSYQQKVVTARRAFTSHEIQRQAIDVLEGNSNLQTKYNVMVDLYQYAVSNDDLDLAQSLRLQIDNVDKAIQAEQEQANKLGATMASLQAQTLEDAIKTIEKERGFFAAADANGVQYPAPTIGELKAIYEEGGEEGINAVMQQIAAIRADGSAPNFWDLARGTMDSIAEMYQTAAQIAGADTAQGRGYLETANKILNGEKTFDVAPGLSKLTYQDVKDAQEASMAGQQLFVPSQENGKNTFRKTNVTDYVYGRDENGNYKLIEVRGEASDFGEGNKQTITVTTADGKTKQVPVSEAKELLAKAGFVVSTDNGQMRIIDSKGLGLPGVSANTSFSVVIGRDGNLRMKSVDGQIFDLELDETGNIKPKKIDAEQDVSIFGEQGLGQYGKSTKQGVELTKQLLGQNRATEFNISDNLRVAGFNTRDSTGLGLDTTELLSRGRTLANFNEVQLPYAALSLEIADRSPFMSADLQKRMNTAAASLQLAASPAPMTVNPQPVATPQLQSSAQAFNIGQTPVPSNASIDVKPIVRAPDPVVRQAVPATTNLKVVNKPQYIKTENKLSF